MDSNIKKIALRMIPYGLYVLTSRSEDGQIAASTINWVSQASFEPPLISVCVKVDSNAYTIIKDSKIFALNTLGKDQGEIAYKFFKSLQPEGNSIGGESFRISESGTPLFDFCIASIECSVVGTLEKGDHSLILGEVTNASVNRSISGRPDDEILTLKDLGVFYGG